MVRNKKLKIFVKQCRLLYKRYILGRGRLIASAFVFVILINIWFSSGDPPQSCNRLIEMCVLSFSHSR